MQTILFTSDALKLIGEPQFKRQILFRLWELGWANSSPLDDIDAEIDVEDSSDVNYNSDTDMQATGTATCIG